VAWYCRFFVASTRQFSFLVMRGKQKLAPTPHKSCAERSWPGYRLDFGTGNPLPVECCIRLSGSWLVSIRLLARAKCVTVGPRKAAAEIFEILHYPIKNAAVQVAEVLWPSSDHNFRPLQPSAIFRYLSETQNHQHLVQNIHGLIYSTY